MRTAKGQGIDLSWPYQAINDKEVLCGIRGTIDRFPPNLEGLESTWVLITILSKSTGLNTGIQYIDYLKILLTQAKRFAVYLFTLPEIFYSVLFRHLSYV